MYYRYSRDVTYILSIYTIDVLRVPIVHRDHSQRAALLRHLEAPVPVYHLACQLGALGAGSGSQLAAGTASQLARRPCRVGRSAQGPVLAGGGRGGWLWQRADAVSTGYRVRLPSVADELRNLGVLQVCERQHRDTLDGE